MTDFANESHCPESTRVVRERPYRHSLLGLAGLYLALLPSPIFSQELQGSWDAVKQLQVSDSVVVVDRKLKSVRGSFSAATEDELQLETDGQPVRIERSDVFRVSKLIRSKRRRNTILGAAIGAGAGAAGGAALAYGVFADEGGAEKPTIAGVAMMASGTVLGTLLGMSSGFETVYRAAGR